MRSFTRSLQSRTAKVFVLLAAAVISLGLWLLAGRMMQPPDESTISSGDRSVLMVLTQTGGMCPDRPCPGTNQKVYTDGRFDGSKPLSSAEISRLKDIVNRTDFTRYEANPDPHCQSYVDGQDLVLSFPGKHGDKQFTPCLLAIPQNDTGIRAITTLLDAHRSAN